MADMLVTPSELAAFLQKDVDTASATLAIEIATGLVQAATEQRIVQVVNDTAVLDLDRHDHGLWIALPQRPVTAVSAVLVGATPVTDYTVQLSRGTLYRSYGWRSATLTRWSAPSTVTVTYTHGYAAGDQRLQLARSAALTLAMLAYENPTGATSEQIDDYAVRYEAAAARMEASPALKQALRRQYGRPAGSVQLVKVR
jgi:hypothetical protein